MSRLAPHSCKSFLMKQHALRWWSLWLRPCVSFFIGTKRVTTYDTLRLQRTRIVANLVRYKVYRMRSHELLMAGLGSISKARVGPYIRNVRDWGPTHSDCDTTHNTVGDYPLKNNGSHIDASLSRQPLVKGERLVRAEMNAVIMIIATTTYYLFGAFATVCLMRAWSLSLLTSCACLRAGARPDGFLRVNADTRRVQRKR